MVDTALLARYYLPKSAGRGHCQPISSLLLAAGARLDERPGPDGGHCCDITGTVGYAWARKFWLDYHMETKASSVMACWKRMGHV
jgi:hypothetical protein